mgnify:FL=1
MFFGKVIIIALFIMISIFPLKASEPDLIKEEIVLIKGGTFKIGEKIVTVRDFYIGKYETTNKEYCLYDPYHENPGDDLPVINLEWEDAVAYCSWLSKKTGKIYRLPSEAEWEYACRAGSASDYCRDISQNINDYCWYCENSGNHVHRAGEKKPNAFGLYDMAGNAWEWCSDWYDDFHSTHTAMGGSFSSGAGSCKSNYRGSLPDFHYDGPGFRIVREME